VDQIKELQSPELTPDLYFNMQEHDSSKGYMTERNTTRKEIEIVNNKVEAKDTTSSSKLQKKTFGLKKKSQQSEISGLSKNVKATVKNNKAKAKHNSNKSILDIPEKGPVKKSSKKSLAEIARPASVMKSKPDEMLDQNCISLELIL
jgi:tRNA G10  N-methylase Trm11